MAEHVGNAEIFDDGRALPFLADPVVSEVFRDKDVGGPGMHGLVNAVLIDSGDTPIGEIVDLIPQRIDPVAGFRGFRIDVLAKTADNEYIVLEVQLRSLLVTNERSLINAEQALISNVIKGDKWADIAKKMPRVIGVNLLDFDLRKTGKNFHQVAEFVYREEPRELASKRFVVHNIQLPRFRKAEVDLNNELHAFLTAVCRSQEMGKTLKEVIEMDAVLAERTKDAPWIKELSNRHEIASANRATRDSYFKWEAETSLMELEIALRYQERDKYWGEVVAKRDAEIAESAERIAESAERIAELEAKLAAGAL